MTNGQQESDSNQQTAEGEIHEAGSDLKSRVVQLEIDLAALADQKFPADSYKRALDVTVREEVYKKLRNVVWALSGLAGIGLVVLAQNFINNSVNTVIGQRHAELAQLEQTIARERLMLYLERLDSSDVQESESAFQTIREEHDVFGEMLVSMIRVPRSNRELDLAGQYASASKDMNLLRVMLDECADISRNRIQRERLLSYVFSFPQDDFLPRVLQIAQDEQAIGGGLARPIVAELGRRTVANSAARDIMMAASRTKQQDLNEAALTFFVINPDVAMPMENGSQLPSGDFTVYTPLYDYSRKDQLSRSDELRILELLAPSARDRFEEADRIWAGLSQAEQTQISDRSVQEDADLIQLILERGRQTNRRRPDLSDRSRAVLSRYFAIRLLEQGRIDLFERILSELDFPEAAWVESVFPLFENVSVAEHRLEGLSDTEILNERIATLSREIGSYSWDPKQRKYVRLTSEQREENSVVQLKAGYFHDYLEIMRATYYQQDRWDSEILPMFPDFDASSASSDPHALQDELWEWVVNNSSRLVLNSEQQVYRLRGTIDDTGAEAAITAVNPEL